MSQIKMSVLMRIFTKSVKNGQNQAYKSPTDLEVFFCPFLSGSNFPNKQSMVQYLRSYHQGISEPQRKSRVNRKLIWLTSKIQCNLFLCRGRRECIMSIFLPPCYRGLQHFSLPEYSENSGKCISITLSTHVETIVALHRIDM